MFCLHSNLNVKNYSDSGQVAWWVGVSSHTPNGCRFNPQSGHVWEAMDGCFSLTSMCLSVCLPPSSPFPKKSIKYILRWRVKKKKEKIFWVLSSYIILSFKAPFNLIPNFYLHPNPSFLLSRTSFASFPLMGTCSQPFHQEYYSLSTQLPQESKPDNHRQSLERAVFIYHLVPTA